MTEEICFYADDRGVRVTNTRLIYRQTTYMMADLTSVKLETKPVNYVPAILLIIIGIAITVLGVVATSITSINSPSPFILTLGAASIVGGIVWAILTKTEYTVKITSASGEEEPIRSKDKAYIQGIVNAINEAFIKRG